MAFEAYLSPDEVRSAHSFKAHPRATPHAKTAPASFHESDCRRAALRLLGSGKDSLALISVGSSSGAFDICEQLARSMARISDGNVALLSLDPARIGEHATLLVTGACGRWLAPSLALITPQVAPAPGEALAVLQDLIRYAAPRAALLVADLSALQGDESLALAASYLFGGVVLLVTAGVAKAGQVQRILREIPQDRSVGALLVR